MATKQLRITATVTCRCTPPQVCSESTLHHSTCTPHHHFASNGPGRFVAIPLTARICRLLNRHQFHFEKVCDLGGLPASRSKGRTTIKHCCILVLSSDLNFWHTETATYQAHLTCCTCTQEQGTNIDKSIYFSPKYGPISEKLKVNKIN